MLTRPQVVQSLLDTYENPRYLEIGVYAGETFFQLEANEKIAVDVYFQFDVEEKKKTYPNSKFYMVPSDEYFANHNDQSKKFDVIFIDGLHTFEQTLRDLCNAIFYLKPDGVILIDDVEPDSYAASMPNHSDTVAINNRTNLITGWMGDVYKLVFFVSTFFQEFSYATVVENHGQMVLWRHPREASDVGKRSVRDIALLEYINVVKESDFYRYKPMKDILSELIAHRDARKVG